MGSTFLLFNLSITSRETLKMSCSTQLSMKIVMLINVKMPTVVGILTCISRINTTTESLKARKVFSFQHYSFLCAFEMSCSVELRMKINFITSGPVLAVRGNQLN